MIKDALAFLVGLGNTEIKEVDGKFYSPKKLCEVSPFIPMPCPLTINTLTGVVDYLNGVDELDLSKIFIHVESPTEVHIREFLTEKQKRKHFISATFETPELFRPGRAYTLEETRNVLLSNFIETSTILELLNIISNIVTEKTKNIQDDGMTTTVVVKKGINLGREKIAVPNPNSLQAYRTFPEVRQPDSLFTIRLKEEKDGEITSTFFESTSGQWKVDAIRNIKQWLEDALPKSNINGMKIIA